MNETKTEEKRALLKVRIAIGDTAVVYVLKLTRAPREYDGFGTFTLQDGWPDCYRLCCVREEHVQWQTGRNASGGYSMLDLPEGYAPQLVIDALWSRLWRGNERGVQL